jgi:NAD(P)-dependent dehydrogenase (short-subunit alcohol dehydrogenase family)
MQPMPTVFITGANRGLGFEFAKQYAREGWRVFAACRDPGSAGELKRLAAAGDGNVEIVKLDVTDLAAIHEAANKLRGASLDLLLNNAGISGAPGQTIGNIDYQSWAKVFDVNAMGPARVTDALVDCVARSDRKLVATISSGMGSIADNSSGRSIAYRSSKAAVNMVMRSFAIDLGPRGITCVVVNPGWVRTDMGGAGASLSAGESVSAMRELFDTLGPAQTGKFFHYDGSEFPW